MTPKQTETKWHDYIDEINLRIDAAIKNGNQDKYNQEWIENIRGAVNGLTKNLLSSQIKQVYSTTANGNGILSEQSFNDSFNWFSEDAAKTIASKACQQERQRILDNIDKLENKYIGEDSKCVCEAVKSIIEEG
jgi:hypothetical protein